MRFLERALLVAGILLFTGLVYYIGPGVLLHDLSLVGAGFAIIFAQEILTFLFNTLGWRHAIRPTQRGVALADLFAMRMAGDAVNYVTPSASIGGEFVKARILRRRIPTTDAVGSVCLAAINQFLSQIVFILASLWFFAAQALTPTTANLAFGVGGFVALACATLVYLGWRRNAFQRMHAFLAKRGWFRHWTKSADAWRRLDENIFGSFRDHPLDSVLSVVYFTLGWGMGVVEIYLILYYLEMPIGWSTAVAIQGLSILVDMSFFYMPAKFGTQEGGHYFIFVMLGLDPATGLAVGIIRRLREIAWAFLGLLVFGYYHHMSRQAGIPDFAAPRRPLAPPSADPPP